MKQEKTKNIETDNITISTGLCTAKALLQYWLKDQKDIMENDTNRNGGDHVWPATMSGHAKDARLF